MRAAAENIEVVKQVQLGDLDMVEVFTGDLSGFGPTAGGLHEDVEVQFISSLAPDTLSYRGVDGLVEGWRDWLAPWRSYYIGIEDLIAVGENQVLARVRVTARTRHDGVTVEHESAAVYTVTDGKIVRAQFYLNRTDLPAHISLGKTS